MGKLVLDSSKIVFDYMYAPYEIKYFIYSDISGENDNNAEVFNLLEKGQIPAKKNGNLNCFASLTSLISGYYEANKQVPNRLAYIILPKIHPKEETHLTTKEISSWVKLCTKYKLMPKNIGEFFLKTNIFIVDIASVCINKLYLYLHCARLIQEEPFLIKTVLYLNKIEKLDFYIAVQLATKFCANNSGHSIFTDVKGYYVMKTKDKKRDFNKHVTSIDIKPAKQLKLYIGKKTPSEKTIEKQLLKKEMSKCYFSLQKEISSVIIEPKSVALTDLRTPAVKIFMRSIKNEKHR